MKNKQNVTKKSTGKPADKRNRNQKIKFRIPDDYHWVVLQTLFQDLKQFLTPDDVSLIDSVLTSRTFEMYETLAEAWNLQCIDLHVQPTATWRARLSIANLLKKFDWPGDREARKLKALDTFFKSEGTCFLFNQINWRALSIGQNDWNIAFNTYIQSFIRKVLGDEPEFLEFSPWMRHGPGSTTSTEGPDVSKYWKHCKWPYHVTSDAVPYAAEVLRNDERWLGALEDSYRRRNNIPKHLILNQEAFYASVFTIVDGSRITTVPKSAKTERTIAIEPTLNLYLQLGVDGFIRRKLKRWGIDIDCQAKNQELARRGSIRGHLATLDLSAASDSISLRLVKQIFPSQWYNLLVSIRSPHAWVENQLVEFEKISSMGNGYTFALETLIFAAIIYAANRASGLPSWDAHTHSVFGDDIIVPTRSVEGVLRGLALCGFAVNAEKSFFSGNSRESCGADWHLGIDFRPVFLHERPQELKSLFSDFNRLQRQLSLWFSIEDGAIHSCFRKWIPEKFRIYGPRSDEEFDTYIHTPAIQWEYWNNWCFKFYRLVSVAVPHNKNTDFLFRKLMNSLSGKPAEKKKWERKAVNSGSSFDIVGRNSFRIVIVPAPHSDVWSDRYNPRTRSGPSLLGLDRFVGPLDV